MPDDVNKSAITTAQVAQLLLPSSAVRGRHFRMSLVAILDRGGGVGLNPLEHQLGYIVGKVLMLEVSNGPLGDEIQTILNS